MSLTDQFLLALQAYQEIRAELRQPETALPDLEIEAPAEGNLLLGLGEDGRLLTLDLYDPAPGPLLVAGDGGCGKTSLLHALARASQSTPDVQFGALTPFPEEWQGCESLPNSLGVWPAYHPSAGDFLAQVAGWAESLSETRQVILLFVDGLELMHLDSPARYHLRWLLQNGPERQVWPFVSVNPARLGRLGSLPDHFETRLLGRVRRRQSASLLCGDPAPDLAALLPPMQFCYFSPQGSLRFWLPPLEGVSDEHWNAVV